MFTLLPSSRVSTNTLREDSFPAGGLTSGRSIAAAVSAGGHEMVGVVAWVRSVGSVDVQQAREEAMVSQFTFGPPGCQLSIAGPGGWYSAYGGRYALQGGTREAHQSPSNQNAPTPLTPSAQWARGNPPAQLDRATVHVDTAASLGRPRRLRAAYPRLDRGIWAKGGVLEPHGTDPPVGNLNPPGSRQPRPQGSR